MNLDNTANERGSLPTVAAESEDQPTKRQKQLPTYEITAIVEAARKPTVEKKLREAFGPHAEIFSVEKVTTAECRADRLAQAEDMVHNAAWIVEELQTEMQDWADSIPQNLQDGQKASEVKEAIDGLQTLLDELQSIDCGIVYFPGMMG